MKTFWIDRFDHMLDETKQDKPPLLSIRNISSDGSLKSVYLKEEEKLINFLWNWLKETQTQKVALVAERQFDYQIIKGSSLLEHWYGGLDKVSLLEMEVVAQLKDIDALLALAFRELVKLTIQTPKSVLLIDSGLAVSIQTKYEKLLEQTLRNSGLYILDSFEAADYWNKAVTGYQQFQQRLSRIKGAVYGMAAGDGLGYPAEFLTIEEIQEKLLPDGFLQTDDTLIKVTDDTQMALAVVDALRDSEDLEPLQLEKSFIKHFVRWLNDPENNRAPGMTCLASCERLEKGMHWTEATDRGSKGCGANMRVLPVGLWQDDDELIAEIAQFQAALTHAHPTALVASELTAIAVNKLLNGTPAEDLLQELFEYGEKKQRVYHQEHLQGIWDRPPFRNQEEFIALGWAECIERLRAVELGLQEAKANIDPCTVGGAGWTAEESLATALYCFLRSPQDPIKALQTAVCTSGDSDSIACLVGGFAGAYVGFESLPKHWSRNIEYRIELGRAIDFLAHK